MTTADRIAAFLNRDWNRELADNLPVPSFLHFGGGRAAVIFGLLAIIVLVAGHAAAQTNLVIGEMGDRFRPAKLGASLLLFVGMGFALVAGHARHQAVLRVAFAEARIEENRALAARLNTILARPGYTITPVPGGGDTLVLQSAGNGPETVLGRDVPAPEPSRAPLHPPALAPVFPVLPVGSTLDCVLVDAVPNDGQRRPLVASTTRDLHVHGGLVLPAGTEVRGTLVPEQGGRRYAEATVRLVWPANPTLPRPVWTVRAHLFDGDGDGGLMTTLGASGGLPASKPFGLRILEIVGCVVPRPVERVQIDRATLRGLRDAGILDR